MAFDWCFLTERAGQVLLALFWQGVCGLSKATPVLRVLVVVLMDGSRVAMLHPRLTCGGVPLCVAMIRHPFAARSPGGVKKARFIGRFDQDQPHHVTMELQGAPPTCDSRSVYMNEYTKGSANYGGGGCSNRTPRIDIRTP